MTDNQPATIIRHDHPADNGAIVTIICGPVVGSIIRMLNVADEPPLHYYDAHIDLATHEGRTGLARIELDDPHTLRQLAYVADTLADELERAK
jgi:hypothetical protein